MKKILLFSAIGFIALTATLIACNKDSVKTTQRNQTRSSQLSTISGGAGINILIFSVNLNRNRGTNKSYQPCNCSSCAGFCDFKWFPLFRGKASTATVGVQRNPSDSTATIYFVAPVDSDLLVNPIYYVDEDVLINNGDTDVFHLKAGEYPYTTESGTFVSESDTFSYHGEIVVPMF